MYSIHHSLCGVSGNQVIVYCMGEYIRYNSLWTKEKEARAIEV